LAAVAGITTGLALPSGVRAQGGGGTGGRGEFYGQEAIEGRTILVRFVISDITATTARFEQAYSADGGRSWEVNWIAVDTRIEDVSRR
jgi:hypothetical protein